MKLVTNGKLNFCPICKAPGHWLVRKNKYYHCGECKANIHIPPDAKVPAGRKWTMDYDLQLKKWYYLDQRGNRCPL